MTGMSKEMQISTAFRDATRRLSAGMTEGAFLKLKKTYPKKFKSAWDELEKNFTVKGIRIFEKKIINGFKKIGCWKETAHGSGERS